MLRGLFFRGSHPSSIEEPFVKLYCTFSDIFEKTNNIIKSKNLKIIKDIKDVCSIILQSDS